MSVIFEGMSRGECYEANAEETVVRGCLEEKSCDRIVMIEKLSGEGTLCQGNFYRECYTGNFVSGESLERMLYGEFCDLGLSGYYSQEK